jgi:calcium-translocating P-type ATPase
MVATMGLTDASAQRGGKPAVETDPAGPVDLLLRDLRASRAGLSEREASLRLERYGPNTLTRRGGRAWPRELREQFTHPLALLLIAAAGLAFVAGTPVLGWAIVAVVILNAGFAFVQERQAERAVEALRAYLPERTQVLREGVPTPVEVVGIVPGDVLVLGEGHRIPADARILDGAVEVDLSTLTGESVPQSRSDETGAADVPLLQAIDLVFSGSACINGSGHALVYATGDHTELGRIASLSQRVSRERSPLEEQVRRVARLIAVVALLAGAAFLPLGLLAGLTATEAFLFAVGLLVANVPEGLLPTITLALAVGVRAVARRGAVVKRLSAVETLGSTTIICSDKTGTITANRMSPAAAWVAGRELPLGQPATADDAALAFATALQRCSTVDGDLDDPDAGDPTETATVHAAVGLGVPYEPGLRDRHRRKVFAFRSELRLMSTVDEESGALRVHVKGAPEAVLARTTTWWSPDGPRPLDDSARQLVDLAAHSYASRGLRVLAVADRDVTTDELADRDSVEKGLRLLGLVALLDPPRPGVAGAVQLCHDAGIKVTMVTGDNGETAAEVARQVGIGSGDVLTGADLANLDDETLTTRLRAGELVLARTSPEDKLRVADLLHLSGEVVAMTGDGVNDAPALRRADIGIAMGRNGTDVAREAATAVLSDDNFATIVAAVEEGRRVYDNVRKFILYIFAHAVPEVVPFLVFALSGGAIPLPLTVLQILAIDLGTETVPALALGREPVEPGVMQRPPRRRQESVVTRSLLLRAWLLLGGVSAVLVMSAFLFTLLRAGWSPGESTRAGSAMHHAYLQATTATFAAIVSCQVGTAIAARTGRASLRSVGLFTNRMLWWGIAFELAFTAALVYLPVANELMGTAPLPWATLALIAPFGLVVWGVDECFRAWVRHRPVEASGPPEPDLRP